MPALVIRHGSTSLNAESGSSVSIDRLRGPRVDPPLSPTGEHEAAETAARLADMPIDHIYSTDLQRGVSTAQTIAAASGAPVSTHRELWPWDYGNLTGMPSDTAKPFLEDLVMHPLVPAPGGGESFAQFVVRFLTFVLPLLRQSTLSAIVTHGRNIKALEAHLAAHGQGIDMQAWRTASLIGPGGVLYATPTSVKRLF